MYPWVPYGCPWVRRAQYYRCFTAVLPLFYAILTPFYRCFPLFSAVFRKIRHAPGRLIPDKLLISRHAPGRQSRPDQTAESGVPNYICILLSVKPRKVCYFSRFCGHNRSTNADVVIITRSSTVPERVIIMADYGRLWPLMAEGPTFNGRLWPLKPLKVRTFSGFVSRSGHRIKALLENTLEAALARRSDAKHAHNLVNKRAKTLLFARLCPNKCRCSLEHRSWPPN